MRTVRAAVAVAMVETALGTALVSSPWVACTDRRRAAACPRGLEPSEGAFADQLPLELGQRCEDSEHEAAGRGGGVDLCALAGEHPQAHAAGGQVRYGVD